MLWFLIAICAECLIYGTLVNFDCDDSPTAQPSDRLTAVDRLTNLQTDWMTDWQNDRLTVSGWQNDRLTDCQADRMTDWQTDRITDWQDDGMTEWQTDRMTGDSKKGCKVSESWWLEGFG